MSKAILLDDRELERDYQVNNKTVITLRLEDDFSKISFYDSTGVELDGEFLFIDESENGDSYLLGRMYAPHGLKKSGIGRAALEFFTEYTGATIYARAHDGIVRDDGSHLTEQAPGFVAKMIKEGLLLDTPDEQWEQE